MGRFSGQVSVVTGSGRGIGFATARRLAQEGSCVVINDVRPAAVDEAVAELHDLVGPVIGRVADVTVEADVEDLVRWIVAEQGRLDILVNNAGGGMPGAAWAPVADATVDDWRSFLDLNLTSAFLCSRAVLPTMLAQGTGHIVNVSSISATNGQVAGAGYASAKAGLTGLTASLAKEVGSYGISVNGIIVGNAPHPSRAAERQAELDSYVHLGRVGRTAEFAAAIAFLCSNDASYLSGTLIPVDGGFHRSNRL